jgi:hypothetical protein
LIFAETPTQRSVPSEMSGLSCLTSCCSHDIAKYYLP